jgi:hypothetical protein
MSDNDIGARIVLMIQEVRIDPQGYAEDLDPHGESIRLSREFAPADPKCQFARWALVTEAAKSWLAQECPNIDPPSDERPLHRCGECSIWRCGERSPVSDRTRLCGADGRAAGCDDVTPACEKFVEGKPEDGR